MPSSSAPFRKINFLNGHKRQHNSWAGAQHRGSWDELLVKIISPPKTPLTAGSALRLLDCPRFGLFAKCLSLLNKLLEKGNKKGKRWQRLAGKKIGRNTATSAEGIQNKILCADNIHDTSQHCQEPRNTLNQQKMATLQVLLHIQLHLTS